MLVSLDRQRITTIPHAREYRVWRSRLTDAEYDELIRVLTERISGDEIVTSSWIPGKDWTGTPYQIIYEKACLEDETNAAFFFGLIVWHTFMLHDATWAFIKQENSTVRGMTYFRVEP